MHVRLVEEREELEHRSGLSNQQATERSLLARHLFTNRGSRNVEETAFTLLLEHQRRQLLLSLIRQLQQYMLSLNSGTTDASYANSESLDSLYDRVAGGQAPWEDALKAVAGHVDALSQGVGGSGVHVSLVHKQIREFEGRLDRARVRALIKDVSRDLEKLHRLE